MYAAVIETELFKETARGCLSGLSEGIDTNGVSVSDELLAFAAGEAFAVLKEVSELRGGVMTVYKSHGWQVGKCLGLAIRGKLTLKCAASQIGSTVSEDFDEAFLERLKGKESRELYEKDGKLYLQGADKFFGMTANVTLSQGLGRFAAAFTFSDKVVSLEDLTLRGVRLALRECWTKQWYVMSKEIHREEMGIGFRS